MAHLGVLCPELSGHLNPMMSLARELERRGHRLTFYARPIGRERLQAAGLHFRIYGIKDYPPEETQRELRILASLSGFKAVRHTIEIFRRRSGVCLRDVPAMVREDQIDAMLVDQVVPEGATVAEEAGIPFVTICNALALHQEQSVPPFNTTWRYGTSPLIRLRNRLAYRAMRGVFRRVVAVINERRRTLGLPPHDSFEDAHSPLLQISQQPPEFEFPGRKFPAVFHFTGPFVDPAMRAPAPFPWDQLNGQPLIYASMGTLQNGQAHVFQTIAAACAGSEAQLIISLGGGGAPESLPPLEGKPIVVAAAPQLELLKRAALCITHAGLNTALECISEGVPMVAIPVTNDQPGVASRLRHIGCGEVVPLRKLNTKRLKSAVVQVLGATSYKQTAERLRAAVQARDGLKEAADHVERVLLKR